MKKMHEYACLKSSKLVRFLF